MSSAVERARDARTWLFVPGDAPDRFAKAEAASPDVVVIDLEDAVAEPRKHDARSAAAEWLDTGHPAAVRVNPPDTEWHADDISMVGSRECIVMVPKSEDAASIEQLTTLLAPGSCAVALIETAKGVSGAESLAMASGVERLAFGSFDLAAQLGVAASDATAMAYPRTALVLASAVAGLAPPVDGVCGQLTDDAPLREETALAARLGFAGKLCIHPRQIPIVTEGLSPTESELRWARAVVDAERHDGVAVLDGQMVDKPVVERARRILRLSRTEQEAP
ncbi:CoA ester lyase [Haloechinothrix sp. YIM 98757]|uniref:CoA ester lyase n=1 Tax=Haloechinothrix aidingensis TaxID=2752311 RepID=A0A838AC45_9PSEU|nr:CoA ester lyase [Haloechinothrix aidingensis]MBA0126803.1 CoA ester lyase [Haloechinothrix aidingensis]